MRSPDVKRLEDIKKALKKKHPGKYKTSKDVHEPKEEPKKTVRKDVEAAVLERVSGKTAKVKVEELNPTPKRPAAAKPTKVKVEELKPAATRTAATKPTKVKIKIEELNPAPKTVVKKTVVQPKLPKKEPVKSVFGKFVAQTKNKIEQEKSVLRKFVAQTKNKKGPEKKKEKSWLGWGKKIVAKTEDFIRKTDWRHLGNELWFKTKKFLYGTALASTVFLSNSSGAQDLKAFNRTPTDTNRKVGRQSSKPDNTIDMQTAINNLKTADSPDAVPFKDPAEMRNEILNREIDKLVANPAFLEDLASSKEFVDAVSSTPEVLADFYMETGNNVLKNFNFDGFEWTSEALQQIHDDGPIVEKIMSKMYIADRKNLDNKHCAAAVASVLTSALGKNYHVPYAYQLANVLDKDTAFIVFDIKGNYALLSHLSGTVFVQDRNMKDLKHVKAGHTGFIVKAEDKKASKAKAKAEKASKQKAPKLRQNSGKNGPKKVPTSNRRNSYSQYGGCKLCFDVYRSCEKEFVLQMIQENRAMGDVVKMAIEYGKKNERELARLVIEYTHLKKECGLDKIPQQVVSAENVQVVKDVQPTKVVDLQDLVTDENSGSHDIIVAKNGVEYHKDSVEHRAFEKGQALKARAAGKDAKKAVKNFAQGNPVKGKRLAAIVKEIRKDERKTSRFAAIVGKFRRDDRV